MRRSAGGRPGLRRVVPAWLAISLAFTAGERPDCPHHGRGAIDAGVRAAPPSHAPHAAAPASSRAHAHGVDDARANRGHAGDGHSACTCVGHCACDTSHTLGPTTSLPATARTTIERYATYTIHFTTPVRYALPWANPPPLA